MSTNRTSKRLTKRKRSTSDSTSNNSNNGHNKENKENDKDIETQLNELINSMGHRKAYKSITAPDNPKRTITENIQDACDHLCDIKREPLTFNSIQINLTPTNNTCSLCIQKMQQIMTLKQLQFNEKVNKYAGKHCKNDKCNTLLSPTSIDKLPCKHCKSKPSYYCGNCELNMVINSEQSLCNECEQMDLRGYQGCIDCMVTLSGSEVANSPVCPHCRKDLKTKIYLCENCVYLKRVLGKTIVCDQHWNKR